jgi:hypothetical protein
MAISYNLVWGPPVTADQLVATFLALAVDGGVLPPTAQSSELTGDGVVLRAGMWCRSGAARPSNVPWPPPVEEDFGVVRSCWVVFRENGDLDRFRQRDEMIWLIAGLLQRLPGDMALHYENEIMWMVRRNGQLYVSERDVNWPAERLALVPPPYQRARLRFSDVPDPDRG